MINNIFVIRLKYILILIFMVQSIISIHLLTMKVNKYIHFLYEVFFLNKKNFQKKKLLKKNFASCKKSNNI